MLRGVVCIYEEKLLINGAGVLLLLLVSSLPLRLFNALNPVGWAGLYHATPTGGRLAITYELACNRPPSMESGFEPGTLLPQSRDLTTRPPRPSSKFVMAEIR
ncbi:hypothetical protein AVEN_256093-1 [Araneus ventricosus]|uniref:Uncharacterized protein n=1 Tax=Araneus ventricosus TaxID=182803 RepID=A0A4Y2D7S3_ARAVE|nr:hypothetical protein AVEN_256093-1 [Araneus ventricosus]